MKEIFLSERALLIEAMIAVCLGRYLFGFEATVLGALAVIAAHIFKMSWRVRDAGRQGGGGTECPPLE